MKDWSLLIGAARDNGSVGFLALFLVGLGACLLYLLSTYGADMRPLWFHAMAPSAWWSLGILCLMAGLIGLSLGSVLTMRGYRNAVMQHHGMVRSAQVIAKELVELRLRPWLRRKPARVLRLGRITYAYQVDGLVREAQFTLSDTELSLFKRIAVGDTIPVRVMPRPPWRATPHRPRLYQLY